ncbi:acetyl-CoA C-acetyltransferase [Myxococcota bacterium]|nr:acetyl-CoA C-acetyltransferase [Myxococcota bacterium]
MRDVVILSGARTPIGSFMGGLSSVPGPRLGAVAIQAAVERAGIAPSDVEEAIMGTVLPAGVGQAPARQAALFAGLPRSVACTTVNKVCGSGLKAVMLAHQQIALGDAEVVVAGGMENMSRSPYLLEKARDGYRMGHGQLVDSMVRDGLWDVYNDFHMGSAAEICAREQAIPKDRQDAFALESYRRARAAVEEGRFVEEIVPVPVPQRRGDPVPFARDEEPFASPVEKLPGLRPVFQPKDGTVTAGNASTINDGAAALVVTSADKARALGRSPLARVVGHVSHAQDPEWFTTAPAFAIEKLVTKLGWGLGEVDLFEVNEAFSVVSLAVQDKLGLDPAKVNVNGGAVALGHPIGASGARILVTLLHAMKARGARRGIASLCIGGGEAVALAVEAVG